MRSINLLEFADHATKIPAQMLNGETKSAHGPLKVLLAHWLDFILIVGLAATAKAVLTSQVGALLINPKIERLSNLGAVSTFAIFATVFIGYFFFSYFFNHGQSLGLMAVKKRIPMRDKSFSDSLKWGLTSSFLLLSGGISSYFMDLRGMAANHDYLYEELMSEKGTPAMKLVNHVDVRSEGREQFLEAA